MKNILTHSFGKSFPSSFVFTGYIFILVGIIIVYNNLIVGLITVLIGTFIGFTKSGIQIDPERKLYRKYDSFFGLMRGKWESMQAYKSIALLKYKEESATLSRSNRRAVTSSDILFDICLLNENHRKKLPIKRLKSKEEATEDLKKLSTLLGFSISVYKPQISPKSNARRKPRK